MGSSRFLSSSDPREQLKTRCFAGVMQQALQPPSGCDTRLVLLPSGVFIPTVPRCCFPWCRLFYTVLCIYSCRDMARIYSRTCVPSRVNVSLWPPCPHACALGMGRAQIRGGLQHLALVALLGARSPSPALHDELWRSWGWAVLKGP